MILFVFKTSFCGYATQRAQFRLYKTWRNTSETHKQEVCESCVRGESREGDAVLPLWEQY